MNNKELQATRKLLFLEMSEAADMIQVPTEIWQDLEDGKTPIPNGVKEIMQELIERRMLMIQNVTKGFDMAKARGQLEKISFVFYASLEEYQKDNEEPGYPSL